MTDIGTLTAQYIRARDIKKRLEEEHKTRLAPLVAAMEKTEAAILAKFNELGIDSAKSENGTAYRSTRTSASVADREAFFTWVKENDAFHMLESRASKTAIEEYVGTSGGNLPPGINWSSEVTVNIRRS
jgi:hypothetical protein